MARAARWRMARAVSPGRGVHRPPSDLEFCGPPLAHTRAKVSRLRLAPSTLFVPFDLVPCGLILTRDPRTHLHLYTTEPHPSSPARLLLTVAAFAFVHLTTNWVGVCPKFASGRKKQGQDAHVLYSSREYVRRSEYSNAFLTSLTGDRVPTGLHASSRRREGSKRAVQWLRSTRRSDAA